MPAFLHENLRILQAVWIKYGVKIDIHKVMKILIIATGHRIHGLIRPGNSIQEGIERPLYQFNKWFLQRELSGAAQGGMFHNMRCPF